MFAFDCRNNGETAWGEGDGECDPETTVRGQSSRAENIPHSHLPKKERPISINIFPSTQPFFAPATNNTFPKRRRRRKKKFRQREKERRKGKEEEKHTTCPQAIALGPHTQTPTQSQYSAPKLLLSENYTNQAQRP